MALHTAYAVTHGSTVLSGLTNLNTNVNSTIENKVSVGSPYPQFVVLRGQRPQIQFATESVQAALALTGSTGVVIDDTSPSPDDPLVAYYALMSNGQVAAGSVHTSYTAGRGLLVPGSLSVQHQQAATLDLSAILYSEDGATEPIAIATDAALPTLTRNNIQHTIGPIQIGGVTFDTVQSVNVNFANGIQTRGGDSTIWDTHLEQADIQPTIEITGLKVTMLAAAGIPLAGKVGTHANTKIFLRKYNTSGIKYVGDATVEHILIDADGLITVESISGSGTASAEASIKITCGLDSSLNAPIGITTAIAIT